MTQSTIPYGAWPSPISAADVARGQRLVSFPQVAGSDVWWQERLPDEGGRVTVVHHAPDGQQRSLLPAPWNARTRVHEYGGLSYLPLPAGSPGAAGGPAIAFANYADQRLYRAGPGADTEPAPLTPAPPAGPGYQSLRYADFTLSRDGREIWCVRERHNDGKIDRAIVAVPLDGSAATNPEAVRELVTGADFFAFPTPSPDGSRLAWVCWNHPRMPWDGTELRVAMIENGVPGKGWLVEGGTQESVLAPLWRDQTSLYLVSDWPGWWNLYLASLGGDATHALYPAEEEFAAPLWQLGQRPYARLGDGRLAVLHGLGEQRLAILDPETAELTEVGLSRPIFTSGLAADGNLIVGVAGGPSAPLSVVRIDAATGTVETLCGEGGSLPDPAYLPVPRHVELEGRFGRGVHALVYPPTNPQAQAPEGELPPYVAWVHGGPTGQSLPLLDVEKAYFTSRGIGVIDVNYGGSSGYGRSYRERLRHQWGVVDVEDVASAARALAEGGEADPARLAIRGGSAGGWTALAAITTHAADRVFSAAASYYGVADLRTFATQTHDFESRYLDGLVGPLPGFAALYAERSPAGHVTGDTCPVLLLQGLDDPVVPPEQAEQIAADLAAHGVPHALLEFAGESHGFRKTETIIACLEAELAFYGQILGFTPPGVSPVELRAGGSSGPEPATSPQEAAAAVPPAAAPEAGGPAIRAASRAGRK
jgi:dipeptidyl aminopeptidase/acylaminoacyl peptidase